MTDILSSSGNTLKHSRGPEETENFGDACKETGSEFVLHIDTPPQTKDHLENRRMFARIHTAKTTGTAISTDNKGIHEKSTDNKRIHEKSTGNKGIHEKSTGNKGIHEKHRPALQTQMRYNTPNTEAPSFRHGATQKPSEHMEKTKTIALVSR
ncbi:MAG: uncharacterized protein A8A55_2445 [Amphiamblys sp. WSBS2006]|nr:MAG: uncharacterized protein A8A55_2445 [Amphiamblys sp. WSBS2006]